MDVLKQIKKNIENLTVLENGIISTIKKTIKDNDVIIQELVSEDQLYDKGINSYEVKISDYKEYSPYTVTIKKEKGQPTNRVTLRDEGDFHESFYVTITDTYFEVLAKDPKTGDLIKKYGQEILGLTEYNISEILFNYILPDLIEFRDKTLNK